MRVCCGSAVRPFTDEATEELPFLAILLFCVLGVIILTLNILLVVFFIRRHRKKHHKGTAQYSVNAVGWCVTYF